MSRFDEITLGDVLRSIRRYQPFLAVVLAVLLLVAFLPGDDDGAGTAVGDVAAGSGVAAGGGPRRSTVNGPDLSGTGAPGTSQPGDGADGALGGSTGSGGTGGAGDGAVAFSGPGADGSGSAAGEGQPNGPLPLGQQFGADCDPATGRIKIPTTMAPPCVPPFSGDNGGATAQGVTADKIKVVFYSTRSDPAVDAALTAAGANNTRDAQIATTRDYVAIFNAMYETYGRTVELVVKNGNGEADDDATGKADAVDIATNIKPFAVIANAAVGPSPAFMKELAARKILCICGTSLPQEFYEGGAPYLGYTPLMSSTQGYIHRAEYIGKRLAKRNAVHAGDPLMKTKPRVFGILYYETPENAYRSGVDFFEKELGKYGVTLKVRLAYTGPPNLAATQEQARPYIQKLKDQGVTSVVFSGDPISPAIFTGEATRQRYNPEWILTGSALTDTTIFGRTYDQTQWAHAFGLSFLPARIPDEQTDAYSLHVWFHGRPPTADNQYGVLDDNPFTFFTGVHLAGPKLTVQSWQEGLFKFPPTGQGRVTTQATSWGRHGLWPSVDYTSYDDVTEIWWDGRATGEDEVGNPGVGMYRYVDGGKRYLPGQHPSSPPRVFDPNGSPTIYNERPANERPPSYPRPSR